MSVLIGKDRYETNEDGSTLSSKTRIPNEVTTYQHPPVGCHTGIDGETIRNSVWQLLFGFDDDIYVYDNDDDDHGVHTTRNHSKKNLLSSSQEDDVVEDFGILHGYYTNYDGDSDDDDEHQRQQDLFKIYASNKYNDNDNNSSTREKHSDNKSKSLNRINEDGNGSRTKIVRSAEEQRDDEEVSGDLKELSSTNKNTSLVEYELEKVLTLTKNKPYDCDTCQPYPYSSHRGGGLILDHQARQSETVRNQQVCKVSNGVGKFTVFPTGTSTTTTSTTEMTTSSAKDVKSTNSVVPVSSTVVPIQTTIVEHRNVPSMSILGVMSPSLQQQHESRDAGMKMIPKSRNGFHVGGTNTRTSNAKDIQTSSYVCNDNIERREQLLEPASGYSKYPICSSHPTVSVAKRTSTGSGKRLLLNAIYRFRKKSSTQNQRSRVTTFPKTDDESSLSVSVVAPSVLMSNHNNKNNNNNISNNNDNSNKRMVPSKMTAATTSSPPATSRSAKVSTTTVAQKSSPNSTSTSSPRSKKRNKSTSLDRSKRSTSNTTSGRSSRTSTTRRTATTGVGSSNRSTTSTSSSLNSSNPKMNSSLTTMLLLDNYERHDIEDDPYKNVVSDRWKIGVETMPSLDAE